MNKILKHGAQTDRYWGLPVCVFVCRRHSTEENILVANPYYVLKTTLNSVPLLKTDSGRFWVVDDYYTPKTGSTSSMTRALTRIEYWDRAGGGRNMV